MPTPDQYGQMFMNFLPIIIIVLIIYGIYLAITRMSKDSMGRNTSLNVAYIFGIIGSVGYLFLTIATFGIGLIIFIPNLIATNLVNKARYTNDKSSALTSALLFLFFGNWISMIFAFVGHSQLPNVVVSHVSNSSNVDSADALLKYKTLLDDGAITLEEFEAKKKEILNV